MRLRGSTSAAVGLAELDHASFGAADRGASEVEEGGNGVRAGDDEGVRKGMGLDELVDPRLQPRDHVRRDQ